MSTFPIEDPSSLLADLDFVRGLAGSLCRDAHEADDVAQDSLATAFAQSPGDLRDRRGWLAAVTRNLARNRRRGERRRKQREQQVATDRSVPSASEVAEREQLRRTVVAAVMALPEPFRAVVLLRHYRGLDTRQCAAELGVPENTVRTRLKRGIDRLRVKLDRDHGGDREAWVTAMLPLALPPLTDTAMPPAPLAVPITGGKKLVAVGLVVIATIATLTMTRANLATPAVPALTTSTIAAASTAQQSPRTPHDPGDAGRGQAARVAAETGATPSWRLEGSVVDSSKLPIAGARLRIWASTGETNRPADQIAIAEVASDVGGRYSVSLEALRALSPIACSQVRVMVNADADGYHLQLEELVLAEEMAADGTMRRTTELAAERLTKGRVVTRAGLPVHDARVVTFPSDEMWAESTGPDGTFALQSPDIEQAGYDLLVIASHPAFGISRPIRVRIAAGGDTRVGDVVLDQTLGVVRGRVHYPGGEPVADQTVTIRSDDESRTVIVGGIEIEDYDGVITGGFGEMHAVQTDADGRFAILNAPPGHYQLDIEDNLRETREFDLGDEPVELDIELDDQHARGQVLVLIEDRDGRWLPNAVYGLRVWHGEHADEAERRYRTSGPQSELLLGADEYEGLIQGRDKALVVQPGSFVVVEASCAAAGPVYASCRLGPDQHRGDLRLVLEQRRPTGSLQIEARAPDGTALQPLLAKLCRVPDQPAVPIYLPGSASTLSPPSVIGDHWHQVPDDGRIDGLPTGELWLELRPSQFVNGRLQPTRYPVTMHRVVVQAGATTTLSTSCEPGVELRLDIRCPSLAANERLIVDDRHISVQSVTDGHVIHHRLVAADRPQQWLTADQSYEAVCWQTLAPGRYRIRLAPNYRVLRLEFPDDEPEGKWLSVERSYGAFERVVDVQPGMPPLRVELTAK